MPDESAELIGGISVETRASNRRLAADLEEANRLLEAWAKQRITINLGASMQPGAAQPGRAASAPAAAPIAFGAGAGTRAQAQQGQTALQRAINAELGKTGEAYNSITGEIEAVTAAAQKQKTVVASVAQTVSKPLDIEVDASSIKADLNEILVAFKEIVAEAEKLARTNIAPKGAQQAQTAAAGGGGGKRRKNVPSAAGGGDDEDEVPTNIAYAPRARQVSFGFARDREMAMQQRANRRAYEEGERARRRELADTHKHYNSIVQMVDQAIDEQENLKSAAAKESHSRRLRELSFEAQQESGEAPRGSTFAKGGPSPQRTQEEITAGNAERARLDAARAAGGSSTRSQTQAAAQAASQAQRREAATLRRSIRSDQARDEEVFARTQVSTEEARERRLQERIATQRANITASARTSRTAASGISALFGGTQGRLIEANARLAASEKAVTETQRQAEPFRRRIAEYDEDIAISSGKVAAARRKSREAFVSDPKTVRALEAEAGALRQQEAALQNLNKLSSGGNIVRNLAAITLGGAAFGIALKGVDVAMSAVSQATQQSFSELTNFSGVSQRVTDELSKSARQASGNVDAVLAQQAAYAGLSAEAAKVINPLVKQRTEIVAGTQAFSDLVDQFQNFQAIQRQGGAGTALTQETGGFAGLGIFGQKSSEQELRRLFSGLPGAGVQTGDPLTPGYVNRLTGPVRATAEDVATAVAETTAAVDVLNKQLERGGEASLRFATSTELGAEEFNRSIKALSDAGFGELANELKRSGVGIRGLQGGEDLQQVLKALTVGNLTPDPDLLRQQFDRQRFATIRQADRQQQFALGTQLPARAALSNLAAPQPAIGTGIVAANAEEQQRITAGQSRAIELQEDLNAEYARGRQILVDTYKVPLSLLNQVKSIGMEIAQTNAAIRNQQAAYQVAQFNYQLGIARRTLSDINGLTGRNFGGLGQSYLGQLEKENLALSRQGQLLQFNLAQRQINFQTALAGFQAPGVTPEERQARIKEAEIEADFAQKQLNIQKQMFGNQVQIVDIQNLRQGADLAAQIGLLLQGRQVTIDTAQAEERLIRLQAQQQILVEQVGTYLTRVDTLAGAAMSEIQQLEAAAGEALTSAGEQAIYTVYGFYRNLTSMFNSAMGQFSQTDDQPGKMRDDRYYATGVVADTLAPTRIGPNGVMGEAAGEKLIVLSNPTALPSGMGGGGGNTFIVQINNPSVRQDGDIDEIVRKVTQAQGRQAAMIGLRGTN